MITPISPRLGSHLKVQYLVWLSMGKKGASTGQVLRSYHRLGHPWEMLFFLQDWEREQAARDTCSWVDMGGQPCTTAPGSHWFGAWEGGKGQAGFTALTSPGLHPCSGFSQWLMRGLRRSWRFGPCQAAGRLAWLNQFTPLLAPLFIEGPSSLGSILVFQQNYILIFS